MEERAREASQLCEIKDAVQRGFRQLSVGKKRRAVKEKNHPVRIPNRNSVPTVPPNIWQRVELPKRLRRHQNRFQQSKLAVVNTVIGEKGSTNSAPNSSQGGSGQSKVKESPKVKKLREKPKKKCVFCDKLDCRSSKYCGLSILWSRRKSILEDLCPDKCCLKQHSGKCYKALKDRVHCEFCGDRHHVVYCECLVSANEAAAELIREQNAATK